MSSRDLPDLVPVRMLNEFVYCPRLFHLEWVQQEWADNTETVSGTSTHAAVDKGGRRLPAPDDMDAPVAARSVDLDAPRLGLVSKIDLVEGNGESVSPVERKRGKPRRDGFVWEPEEIQVVAQAMILRENGYRVDEAIVAYPSAKTRVHVPITAEREERVRAHLRLLHVAATGPMPAPLVDSPKCPRCSLVGICLPDETALVTADNPATRPAVRRLLAPDHDAQPLHVFEPGAAVGRRGDRVVVTRDGETLASLRAIDVAQVSLFGAVSISPVALRRFCDEDVVITHHSGSGWLAGVTSGPGHKNADLRIAQFATASDPVRALAVARRMIEGKVRNQRTLLRRNSRVGADGALAEMQRMIVRIPRAADADTLLGLEGNAARSYFGAFPGMVNPPERFGPAFDMAGRNRRPPRDPINTLLSFTYALLVRETTVAAIRVGMDPYVGVFHRPRYGRPALALDLAEEFRPIVGDSVVITMVNNAQIQPSDFISRAGAWALTTNGKRAVAGAFERRMSANVTHPLFKYSVTYRRAIELQMRLLARVFVGEFDEYQPFTTR